MEKIGFVKSIDGNAAIIEIMRFGACGDRCSSCKAGNNNIRSYSLTKLQLGKRRNLCIF